MDAPFAVLLTDRRITLSPLASMGCHCTTPGFWSGSALDKGPSAWLHSLSREQAIDAARQLHRDVCLITTNLSILDQYALCLQGTAAKILELSLGSRDFPSMAVAAGAMAPRVRRVSVQMEAMGLWRPSLDPAGFEIIAYCQL